MIQCCDYQRNKKKNIKINTKDKASIIIYVFGLKYCGGAIIENEAVDGRQQCNNILHNYGELYDNEEV